MSARDSQYLLQRLNYQINIIIKLIPNAVLHDLRLKVRELADIETSR